MAIDVSSAVESCVTGAGVRGCAGAEATVRDLPARPWLSIGDALGVMSLRVQGDVVRFKEFIEKRGHETGAWRDQV